MRSGAYRGCSNGWSMQADSDGLWQDSSRRAGVRFYGQETDPAHSVAGHLDHPQAHILNACGEIRG